MTDSELLLALSGLAVCSGAAVQSATGFGFALVAAPALFAVEAPEAAATAVLILSVALNLLMLLAERGRLEIVWRPVGRMLVAALPGLVAGTLLIRAVSGPALQVAVGAAVLAAAGLQALAAARTTSTGAGNPAAPYAVGLLSGALTTSTTINGPPLALWLQSRRARPRQIRDSLAASFLALNLAGVATLALLAGSEPDGAPVPLLGALLGATVAGHLLGRRVFERLPGHRFRAVGLVVAAAAGAASVLAGVLG